MRADNNSNDTIIKSTQLSKFANLPGQGNTPGERIRWARYKKGLDIVDVARMANLSEGNLSRIENSRGGGICVTTIKNLSTLLEQPIWFLGCYENLPEKTIGQRIRKARLYHGMTNKEFAESIGVNEKTVRLWESDLTKPSKRIVDITNFSK